MTLCKHAQQWQSQHPLWVCVRPHRSASGFLKVTGAPRRPMLLTGKNLLFKHLVNLMSFFFPMTAVSKLSMLYKALLTNLTLYR